MSAAPKSPQTVAYLGPRGSYSHQATTQHFPSAQDFTLSALPTIESVFAAVQSGSADHGVVPFENSSNGPVAFTLDLFAADTHSASSRSSVQVTAEIYLPVHHCLVGHLSSKDNLSRVTKLYSHPQAWGQCGKFLRLHASHVAERNDTSSTSRAAELVKDDHSGASAAISSALAAELNGLEVLAEGIEDDVGGNCTRFLVLRRSGTALGREREVGGGRKFKTLLCFALSPVGFRTAGSLADALAVFKTFGISLTSITTRPSGRGAWEYVFFVEFAGRVGGVVSGEQQGEGVRRSGGEEVERVDEALKELGEVVGWWRWLGSWEDAMGRE